MPTPLYIDYFDLRFNTNLHAMEYNTGGDVWAQVPVPVGDLGLASGHILVGNASNLAADVAMSGDVTIANTGATTIGANKVTTSTINAAAITPAKISTTSTDNFTFPNNVTVANLLTVKGQSPNTDSYKIYSDTNGTFYIQRVGYAPVLDFDIGSQQVDMWFKLNMTNGAGIQNATFIIAGATNIAASAILEADSTTQGFLPPRMTTTQKGAISSPATGLVVYDSTLNKLCVYTGSAWETVTSS